MGTGDKDEMFLELLRNIDSRHDIMYDELVQLRAGFSKVVELNCELAHQKSKTAELEAELTTLKNELKGISKDLIVPMTVGKSVKWFALVALTALITVWVNTATGPKDQLPKQFPHNVEKSPIKKTTAFRFL